jgi:hypothetical protein
MNKLVLHEKNDDKRVITFMVNRELREQLTEILKTSEKYTLKKKSDWINESILMLQENPDYKEMVLNAEGSNKDFVLDKVKMTFSQRCLFSNLRKEVVVSHPDIRGPQGAIIRAAILSRIVRGL